MKTALHSVTYSGYFYEGEAVPLNKLILKVADIGYDGIELLAKRPHAYPMDLDKKGWDEIKELAESVGIEICAIAALNDFSWPDYELRLHNLLYVKEIVRLARDLNVKIVRIFAAGFREMHPASGYMQQWEWCRECIKESAKFAEEYGVILGLQNHSPIMQSYKNVIDMINQVGSDNLKVVLDPHILWEGNENISEAVEECGDLIVHAHLEDFKILTPLTHGLPGGQLKYYPPAICPLGEGMVDHKTFVNALKKIRYEGFLSYPICEPVYVNYKLAPITVIDQWVGHGLIRMRKLIAEA